MINLDGDVLFAAKKFNEAELLFANHCGSKSSINVTAYVYYAQDYYFDAESELKRFIKTLSQKSRFKLCPFFTCNVLL